MTCYGLPCPESHKHHNNNCGSGVNFNEILTNRSALAAQRRKNLGTPILSSPALDVRLMTALQRCSKCSKWKCRATLLSLNPCVMAASVLFSHPHPSARRGFFLFVPRRPRRSRAYLGGSRGVPVSVPVRASPARPVLCAREDGTWSTWSTWSTAVALGALGVQSATSHPGPGS